MSHFDSLEEAKLQLEIISPALYQVGSWKRKLQSTVELVQETCQNGQISFDWPLQAEGSANHVKELNASFARLFLLIRDYYSQDLSNDFAAGQGPRLRNFVINAA